MPRLMLTDDDWVRLCELMKQTGRVYQKRAHRMTLEGILYRVRTGCPWRDLPAEFGRWNTVFRRFNLWSRKGVMSRVFKATSQDYDSEWVFIDASIVRADQHSHGAASAADQAIGSSREGRTTKLYFAVDSCGLPVHFDLSGGQVHDLSLAQELLEGAPTSEQVVADKGYHKASTLAWLYEREVRTYIPQRRDKRKRRWDDKPEGWREAVYENRRRVERDKGKQYQRRRAEVVERSFAHLCTTGGSRRTWIRGMAEVGKRYLVSVMAHNLGVILRNLIGAGKPREWASMRALLAALDRFWSTICSRVDAVLRQLADWSTLARGRHFGRRDFITGSPSAACSTGC